MRHEKLLITTVWNYHRIGYDTREMTFGDDGEVDLGARPAETFWSIVQRNGENILKIGSHEETTCEFRYEVENNRWFGKWLVCEQMDVELIVAGERLSPTNPEFIRLFAPDVPHRPSFVAALQVLKSLNKDHYTLVEIIEKDLAASVQVKEDGTKRIFDWFSSYYIGSFQRIHLSAVETAQADLLFFNIPLNHQAIVTIQQTLLTRAQPPGVILIARSEGEPNGVSFDRVVAAMWIIGYIFLSSVEGHLCFRLSTRTRKTDLLVVGVDVHNTAPATKLSDQHIWTKFYEAEIHAPSQSDFASLRNRNILFYWPHGLGDWVFLSYVFPLLEPSNRYFVARFGDDSSALYEGSDIVTPLYIGLNSPHLADGRDFHIKHFGMHYESINGSSRMLELPLGLHEQFSKHKIDTVLFSSFSETYGCRDFPFHSKCRNAIPQLVTQSSLAHIDLDKPLQSALHLKVDSWLQCWVEARLNNQTGWGKKKLCLICRNGYTSIGKNWGHKWREHMPIGKQREGEEARDFMRLLLTKDPNWIFLNFEDKLFTGDDTISDLSLNSYSFAEIFNYAGSGCAPYALMLKALMQVADLCIGVPAGPYHLSNLYNDFPSIGVWLDHLPCWYDEPKAASVNIISRWAQDHKMYVRPGSFDKRGCLDFHARHVDTLNISGEQVLESVESLLY